MSNVVPTCRTAKVFAFRGDRGPFGAAILKALEDARKQIGPSPNLIDCLLWAGHTGVSTDLGATIYGFNPVGGRIQIWQLMEALDNGDAFPGIVTDDTGVFYSARNQGLSVLSFDVILPDPKFQRFEQTLDNERQQSQYEYGFPDGNGDCNCTTWLERMGLPLLTGRMSEFVRVSGVAAQVSRRFGLCV